VIAAKDDNSFGPMTAELLTQLPQDGIRDNVSVWQGGSFTSYRLFAASYLLGDSTPIESARLLLPQYPVLVALGLLAMCFVFAVWIRILIREKIRERLAFPPGILAGKAESGAGAM
jgi:hypothetical protein